MDFRQQYESAQEWADGEKDFSVGSEDEEERNFRLTILNTDLVFTITVPKEDDRDWVIFFMINLKKYRPTDHAGTLKF